MSSLEVYKAFTTWLAPLPGCHSGAAYQGGGLLFSASLWLSALRVLPESRAVASQDT